MLAGRLLGGGSFTPASSGAFSPYLLAAAPFSGWQLTTRPQAIHYAGVTYWGYIQGTDGDLCVHTYDHATEATAQKVLTASFLKDSHASPSLLVRDSDHKLLVFASGHAGANQYLYVSTTSLDTDPLLADGFAARVNLDSQLGATAYTYGSAWQLTGVVNDPIWLFVRNGTWSNPSAFIWRYSTSEDGGATWSVVASLWKPTTGLPYIITRRTSTTRIDFLASNGTPSVDTDVSIYHWYYDGGWFKTDGTSISPPFDESDVSLVYNGTGNEGARAVDIALGADGHPRGLMYSFETSSDARYRWCRWSGSAWSDHEVAADAKFVGLAWLTGGACLNPTDPDTLYASRNVSSVMQVFKYDTADNGATFDDVGHTLGGSAHRFVPAVPINATAPVSVIFHEGAYAGATNYNAGTGAA